MTITSVPVGSLGIADLAWPVTIRWVMSAPWGWTSQELSLDVPYLANDVYQEAHGSALARELWAPLVGAPTCSALRLEQYSCVHWKNRSSDATEADGQTRGQKLWIATGRDDSAQLLLHTGRAGGGQSRRFFLPAIPEFYVRGGMLTTTGFEELLAHARGAMFGLWEGGLGNPMQWLFRIKPTFGDVQQGVGEVRFQKVAYCRVLQHTDKAPDLPFGAL